ncbi:uncharacterized protein LOC111867531 isoform X3 [Cryptotermes secundus]|uniref:uncharacterized protein LOC111867531 isoform X3 n=1 Tax=Cryptotermes secundus TaxID=105785 RepID=UPI001454E2EA|nr:uncharacterized protein LOC111867531 isoform X3 [Cryptotermes secundus]
MATVPQTPQEQALRLKPKLSLLRLKSYSTDPDGNSPSCSTPRSNVSWADNCHDVLQADTQQHDKMAHYGLPAPCIFKLMQVVLACTVMGLYINAPITTTSSKLILFLNPAVIGGYIIIIAGLIMGLIINEQVPRKMDMLYMTGGFILFIAAGSMQIYFHGTRSLSHTKDKDIQKNTTPPPAPSLFCNLVLHISYHCYKW